MKEQRKPNFSTWQSVCFMLRTAWRGRKSVLVYCVVLAALSVGISLINLYIAPMVLKEVEQAASLQQLLCTIGSFTLALLILLSARSYMRQMAVSGQIQLRSDIRNAIGRKAGTTSYPNTCDPATMKLQESAANATRDNESATERIWAVLIKILFKTVSFVIFFLLLSELGVLLIAAVLVPTAAGFLVSAYIYSWNDRNQETYAGYLKQFSYIRDKAESMTMAKDIRLFGLQSWITDIQESALRMYEAFINRREKKYLLANVADVVLSVARNGIAYVYLIHLTLSRGLPASEFLLFFNAVGRFAECVTAVLVKLAELQTISKDIVAVREYLNLSEQFLFAEGEPIPSSNRWEVRLEDVTFRYPGSDEVLFSHLNLTVHAGEKMALVGLNGVGKTSLVKLICGFYDPDEGRVLLNGTDIRQFDRRAYYKLFSAVFQEFSVLDATVAENVAQSVHDIDMARVARCIRQAGLWEQIARLPQGIDTHIGRNVYLDGVQLSGGQTQRLMLARALYKDAPILILDEPTAALDPIAEDDIYRKYHEMTDGKTAVFVSHRLASTQFCDRIVFLADGSIAEEGTHEQLLALDGAYAQLFEVQSRYYRRGR